MRMKLLKKNMPKLDKIAQNLIERETLTGAEINIIMSGKKLPPIMNHEEKQKPSHAHTVENASDSDETRD